ncbi:MAG: Nif3-like dinuclear metal center hexameric protein [Myxococcota bacterium]
MASFSLPRVVGAIEEIAPPSYASSWDNVGLLIEPPSEASVARIILCIDLTEGVLDEAKAQRADLIVAYHPPIFGGLKRLTQSVALHRSLMRAIAEGIAIYSPHTALDAAEGGVCDWLAQGLGAWEQTTPLEPNAENGAVGVGRLVSLASPTSLVEIAASVKAHLGLQHLRVARHERHQGQGATIRTVALCPGAGGGLFEGVQSADLFLTGEMSHHDILARVAQGASVILTDHSHSERGYLPVFRERLASLLGDGVDISVSVADIEPLEVL